MVQEVIKLENIVRNFKMGSEVIRVLKSISLSVNKGEYVVKEATMAKLKSTKVADETIYSCLQMLGGYGYMEEYPLARLLRDSRLGPIGGGTSEILREILSKLIIDKQNYKPAVK
jgi:alkylation response protein AidB-like acyl-CoA dehydrogenase